MSHEAMASTLSVGVFAAEQYNGEWICHDSTPLGLDVYGCSNFMGNWVRFMQIAQ